MRKTTILFSNFIILALTLNTFVFAQTNQFKPSYQINKAKATIHYFFSNFEQNPRIPKGVISMLSKHGFELNYPWGVYKTKKDVENWLKEIPNEFHDAHHIKTIKVEIIDKTTVKAEADVIWQNSGPNNSFDIDHFLYAFELIDEGRGLLKIKTINCRRID